MKAILAGLLTLLTLTTAAQQIKVTENIAYRTGGTYAQPNGGANARMVRAWIDWQLEGKQENKTLFVEGDLTGYDGWTIMNKNIKK